MLRSSKPLNLCPFLWNYVHFGASPSSSARSFGAMPLPSLNEKSSSMSIEYIIRESLLFCPFSLLCRSLAPNPNRRMRRVLGRQWRRQAVRCQGVLLPLRAIKYLVRAATYRQRVHHRLRKEVCAPRPAHRKPIQWLLDRWVSLLLLRMRILNAKYPHPCNSNPAITSDQFWYHLLHWLLIENIRQ